MIWNHIYIDVLVFCFFLQFIICEFRQQWAYLLASILYSKYHRNLSVKDDGKQCWHIFSVMIAQIPHNFLYFQRNIAGRNDQSSLSLSRLQTYNDIFHVIADTDEQIKYWHHGLACMAQLLPTLRIKTSICFFSRPPNHKTSNLYVLLIKDQGLTVGITVVAPMACWHDVPPIVPCMWSATYCNCTLCICDANNYASVIQIVPHVQYQRWWHWPLHKFNLWILERFCFM